MANRQVTIQIRGNAQGLTQALQAAQQGLKALAQQTQATGVSLTGATQQGQQGMAKLDQQTQAFHNTMRGLQGAAGGLGVALLAAVGGSLRTFAQFEEQLNRTQALAGATKEQMAALGAQILRDAPALARSPKDLADGLYFVVSAGFAASKSMDILTAATKASAAENANLHVVADGLTSIMQAYGIEASKAESVTDKMTVAVVEGKLEFDNLAGSIGRVAPVAKIAGLSLGEMLGSITMMTRTGLSADEAATALRAALINLEKPAKATQAALAGIGLSADDVRNSIRDRGLIDTLQMLMEKTDGNIEVLGRIIPNIRGLVGVLSAASGGWEEYKRVVEEIDTAHGQTQESFTKTSETIEFKMRQIGATVQTAAAIFGQQLAPMVKSALDALAGFLATVSSYLAKNPEWTEHAATLAAVAGAMLTLAGGARALQSAIYLVGVAFGPMFVGLRSANLAMLEMMGTVGPIAAALLGIRLAAGQGIPVVSGLGNAMAGMSKQQTIAAVEAGVMIAAIKPLSTIFTGVGAELAKLGIFLKTAALDFQNLRGSMAGLGALGTVTEGIKALGRAFMELSFAEKANLILMSVAVAVGTLEVALRFFTGKGLFERVFGGESSEAKAHAEAVAQGIREIDVALQAIDRDARDNGLTTFMANIAKLDAILRPAHASLEQISADIRRLMSEFGKEVFSAADFKNIINSMPAVKRDFDTLKDSVEASTKALEKLRTSGQPLPPPAEIYEYIQQFSKLRDELKYVDEDGFKKTDALVKELEKDMTASGRAVDKAFRDDEKAVRDFQQQLRQTKQTGDETTAVLASGFRAVSSLLQQTSKDVENLHKHLKDIGKEPTKEMQDLSAAAAILDANTDQLANKSWPTLNERLKEFGPGTAAVIQGAYDAATAALGWGKGIETTTGQLEFLNRTVKISKDGQEESVRVIDMATGKYEAHGKAVIGVAEAQDKGTRTFDQWIMDAVMSGVALDSSSSAALKLALQSEGLRSKLDQVRTSQSGAGDSAEEMSRKQLEAALAVSDTELKIAKLHNDYISGKITLDQYHQQQDEAVRGMKESAEATQKNTEAVKADDSALNNLIDSTKKHGDSTVHGEAASVKFTETLDKQTDSTDKAATATDKAADAQDRSVSTGARVSDKLTDIAGRFVDAGQRADDFGGLTDGAFGRVETSAQQASGTVSTETAKASDDANTNLGQIGQGFGSHLSSVVTLGMGLLRAGMALEMLGLVLETNQRLAQIGTGLDQIAYQNGFNIGFNLTAGVLSGLNSNLGAIQATAASIIATATAAANAKAEVKSPSRVWAELGRMLLLGLIEGIDEKTADLIGKVVDSLTKVLDAAQKTLSLLPQLIDTEVTPEAVAAMQRMAGFMADAVGAVFAAGMSFNEIGLAQVSQVSDAAGKVMDAMTKVIGLLKAMKDLRQGLSDSDIDNVRALAWRIEAAIGEIFEATKEMNAVGLAHVGDVSDNASKLFDALAKVVGVVKSLRDLTSGLGAPDDEQITQAVVLAVNAMVHAIELMDKAMASAAPRVGTVSENAAKLLDAVAKVVDVVAKTRALVDGIGQPDDEQLGYGVILANNAIVRMLSLTSQDMAEASGFAGTVSENAGKVIDVVGKVVDVVMKVRELKTKGIGAPDDEQIGYGVVLVFNAIARMIALVDQQLATDSVRAGIVADNAKKVLDAVGSIISIIQGLRQAMSPAFAKAQIESIVKDVIDITNVFIANMPILTDKQKQLADKVLPVMTALFGALKDVLDVIMVFSNTTTIKSKQTSEFVGTNKKEMTDFNMKTENELEQSVLSFDVASKMKTAMPEIEARVKEAVAFAATIVRSFEKEFAEWHDDGLDVAAHIANNVKSVIGAIKDAVDLLLNLGDITGENTGDTSAFDAYAEKVRDARQTLADKLNDLNQEWIDAISGDDASKDGGKALAAKMDEIGRKRTQAQTEYDRTVAKADADLKRAQDEEAKKAKQGNVREKMQRGIANLKVLLDDILKMLGDLVTEYEKKFGEQGKKIEDMFGTIGSIFGTLKTIMDTVAAFGDTAEVNKDRIAKFVAMLPGLTAAITGVIDTVGALASDDTSESVKKVPLAVSNLAALNPWFDAIHALLDKFQQAERDIVEETALADTLARGIQVLFDKWFDAIGQESGYLDDLIRKLTDLVAKLKAALALAKEAASLQKKLSHALGGGGGGDDSGDSDSGGSGSPDADGLPTNVDHPPAPGAPAANGAIVTTGAQYRLVGEAGPEAVLPLNRPDRFWSLIADLASNGLVPSAPPMSAPTFGGRYGGDGPTHVQGDTYHITQQFTGGQPTPADVRRETENMLWTLGVKAGLEVS